MKIKITSSKLGKNTRVWLDEHEITKAVRAVQLDWEVNHVNRVNIELFPQELEIETESYADVVFLESDQ